MRTITKIARVRRVQQRSPKMNRADIETTHYLLHRGFHHKRIAALFDVNQGRISEISTGQRR